MISLDKIFPTNWVSEDPFLNTPGTLVMKWLRYLSRSCPSGAASLLSMKNLFRRWISVCSFFYVLLCHEASGFKQQGIELVSENISLLNFSTSFAFSISTESSLR